MLDWRRNEHVRVKIMYSLEERVFLISTYVLTNRNWTQRVRSLANDLMCIAVGCQQRVLFNVLLRSSRRLEACMMTREGSGIETKHAYAGNSRARTTDFKGIPRQERLSYRTRSRCIEVYSTPYSEGRTASLPIQNTDASNINTIFLKFGSILRTSC